jgi:hypothetical protein
VKPLQLGAREIMLNRVLDIRQMGGDPNLLDPLHRMWIFDIRWRKSTSETYYRPHLSTDESI